METPLTGLRTIKEPALVRLGDSKEKSRSLYLQTRPALGKGAGSPHEHIHALPRKSFSLPD